MENPILNDLNALMDELIDVQLLLTEKLDKLSVSNAMLSVSKLPKVVIRPFDTSNP